MDYFKRTLWEGRPCYREERSTFVVRVKQFSNTNVHNPDSTSSSDFIDYDVNCEGESYSDISDYLRHRGHSIVVYANGRDSSTEGFVSLVFRFLPDHVLYEMVRSRISRVDLTFLIAVVDAEDGRRLPQSYAFTHDATEGKIPDFCVLNFISREFLLTADDDNLLPDDTLTLQVDVVLGERISGECRYVNVGELVKSSFQTEGGVDGEPKRRYLLLNSVVAERLRLESKYFEHLSTTPFSERNSNRLEIPDGEYYNFLNMVITLWRLALYNCTMEFTFQHVLDIYATADYYGVESVLDTCRRWIRLACRTDDDVLAISRLADQYGDPLLLEIALAAPAIVEKSYGLDLETHPGEPDEEWTCRSRFTVSNVQFLFQPRLKNGLEIKRSEDAAEDVSEILDCYL